MDRRRLGAVAGALSAVVFATVFTVEGWLRLDYDWRTRFVSELALGPRGFVQILNFLFLGASQLLFARGLAAEFPDGKGSRMGPVLLAAVGLGFLFGGAFVMDPVGTPRANTTWQGWLHGRPFGPVILFAWPLACFVFWRRFQEDPRWRPLATFTLASGGLAAVLAVVLLLQVLPLVTQPELGHRAAWAGAVQRGHHGVLLAWQLVVAVRLFRGAATPRHGGPDLRPRSGASVA